MNGAEDPVDLLRLARGEGIGPVTWRRLFARYRSAAAAIDALPGIAHAGPPRLPSRPEARRELDALDRLGGRMLFLGQPGYPALLALLDSAPPALAVLGDPQAAACRCVALVGARNASANGMRMAESLAEAIAAAGMPVVSGLARGIDTAAHLGAMRKGRTIAAIAGGLDVPYPPENAALQARIAAEGGAVFAEAPLGTAPQARHFPRRNRIIAGLALGIVVVEAAHRSGALITARYGQEAGREIYAVPGSPLDPRCRGSNHLLRQGATLTETIEDILENLPEHPGREGLARDPLFAYARRPPAQQDSASELPGAGEAAEPGGRPAAASAHEEVLEMLGASPSSVDDLIRRCQFSASAVMAALLELEVAGRVQMLPGNLVALLPSAAT